MTDSGSKTRFLLYRTPLARHLVRRSLRGDGGSLRDGGSKTPHPKIPHSALEQPFSPIKNRKSKIKNSPVSKLPLSTSSVVCYKKQ
ncbi:MAG: hypothetical protein JWR19_694 [Pedosphaera sp.]|nr:hypothetical protein [Pedosphaera sp.]